MQPGPVGTLTDGNGLPLRWRPMGSRAMISPLARTWWSWWCWGGLFTLLFNMHEGLWSSMLEGSVRLMLTACWSLMKDTLRVSWGSYRGRCEQGSCRERESPNNRIFGNMTLQGNVRMLRIEDRQHMLKMFNREVTHRHPHAWARAHQHIHTQAR